MMQAKVTHEPVAASSNPNPIRLFEMHSRCVDEKGRSEMG
jgi:hypothetical protein